MKKTIKSLLAIAITALAFTACSDVPEPYQIPGTGGGTGGGGEIPGATGTGQLTDPYNVAAAMNTGGYRLGICKRYSFKSQGRIYHTVW